MKPSKIFGFAALVAFMATAFVGASSAMAEGSTALCKADESPCATGNIFTHIHAVSVGKEKLLTEGIGSECDVLFLGDAAAGGLGNPLVMHGAFTYSNCSNNCTISEENGPAEVVALRLGHETADIYLEWLFHVSCMSNSINCWYKGVSLEGIGKGPLLSVNANGDITFSGQVLTWEKGILCSKVVELDITLTPLVATYISS